MFDTLQSVGITPSVVQLLIVAGVAGFILFTFWRFFVVGAVCLFVVYAFAGTNTTKKEVSVVSPVVIAPVITKSDTVEVEEIIVPKPFKAKDLHKDLDELSKALDEKDNKIASVPKDFLMDCMVILKASEEECKNNWSKKQQ